MSVFDTIKSWFEGGAVAGGMVAPQATDQRTALEKLATHIPGFGGYLERQHRRAQDQILRSKLADMLRTQQRNLAVAITEIAKAKQYHLITQLGSANTQLQTFIDRVRVATYGYSGLFDAERINQAELEQIYNFDAALFEYVGRLETAIGAMRSAIRGEQDLPEDFDLETIARIVLDICRQANATFDQRRHLILRSQ